MTDWNQRGESRMTDAQRRMLNAACGDLAEQVPWHGNIRLSKDDYRHMICGTLLGWKFMPGIDLGDGQRGFITLGGSSLNLTKSQATDAITICFTIGDDPSSQDLPAKSVRWCAAVCLGRYITEEPAPRRERVAA
jgi:hypothetical protein